MTQTQNHLVTEFRAALDRGELVVQHCESCGRPIMYPRHACPFCQSTALGWRRSSERGQLMSFTVLRFGAPEGFEQELPYGIGIVRLEEGVQLLCRLRPGPDGSWDHYVCNMEVVFTPNVGSNCAWFVSGV